MKKNFSTVGAIKTEYKGYYFDSRTEAKWAVFFDACGVDWEYRTRTFDLGNGEKYRPDFLLHGVAGRDGGDLYIEVKGCMNDERVKKIESFIKLGASVAEPGSKFRTAMLLVGKFPDGSTTDKILENIQKTAYETQKCELNYYNFSTIDGDMFAAYPGVNKDGCFELFGDDYSYLCDMDRDATAEAYCKARKFKFDEGVPSKAEIDTDKKPTMTLAEFLDKSPMDFPEFEHIKETGAAQDVFVETLVLYTHRYDLFKKLVGNRDTEKRRKENVMESIKAVDALEPIKANEAVEIIDGQARYEARKELAIPLHFFIAQGEGIEECRATNRCKTSWTARNYVPSYITDENPNYIALDNVQAETGLSYDTIAKICGQGGGGNFRNKINEGVLSFTQADADKVRSIAKLSAEIIEALAFTKRPNATFYDAVRIASNVSGYSHKRMLTNCKNCRGTYNQMSNLDNQLKEFSRIYNYRGKNKLYFEDYKRNKNRKYENTDYSWHGDLKKNVSTLR